MNKKCVRCGVSRQLECYISKYGREFKNCYICRTSCNKKRKRWLEKKGNKEKERAWHHSNKEYKSNYQKKWQKENKDKLTLYRHRRRELIKGGDLTSNQIKELFITHPFCEYCHSIYDLCLDHIIPISKGGLNTLSNVTIACRSCNCSKHNKLLSEWRV